MDDFGMVRKVEEVIYLDMNGDAHKSWEEARNASTETMVKKVLEGLVILTPSQAARAIMEHFDIIPRFK